MLPRNEPVSLPQCGEDLAFEQALGEVQQALAQGQDQDLAPWDYLLGNAFWMKRWDTCHWLLSQGMDSSPHLLDVIQGVSPVELQLEWLGHLKRYGARVPEQYNHLGDTIVHVAVEMGQLEVLRYLVEELEGRWAFSQSDQALDRTPLHVAVWEGHLECARYLLQQGHDPNATAHVLHPGRMGRSILEAAVRRGDEAMVRLLLEWKADPDFPGWMGTTARDRAEGTRFEALLAIPPLAQPQLSPHRQEIERQLLELEPGCRLDWHGCRASGPVHQLRGDPLQAADEVSLLDPDWRPLRRGRVRFLILTPQQELRAFWLEEEGHIPDPIWNALTPDQHRHLASDRRNQEFCQDIYRRWQEFDTHSHSSCPQGPRRMRGPKRPIKTEL